MTPTKSMKGSPDRSTLGRAYGREFFQAYGAANTVYVASCERVARELAYRLAPSSVVDWGCGAALHAAAMAKLGVDVIGVDGVLVDDDLRAPEVSILVADLRRPVDDECIPSSFELSLCIDVLEHIDDADSGAVLDNVCRARELVVLSCAPPHQGGHHHVNERPRRDWIARMRERGWHYDRMTTGEIERTLRASIEAPRLSWTYHNLCIYRREPTPGRRLAKRRRGAADRDGV